MKKLIFTFIILVMTQLTFAAGITFTFANVVFTGTSPLYFEFDVMAQADAADTRLGDTQVYINYNTVGFGSSIKTNGKITVTKGTLLSGELIPGLPLYQITNVLDNTASRVSVANGYIYPTSPTEANLLPTTPTQLLHVKIEIADINQNAGLSFESSLMNGQQYYSDNATKYSPVTATDTDDSSLNPLALEEITSDIPTHFQLKPNFPNPFNPSTMLEFAVPRFSEKVELTVYDVLGRQIAILYAGNVPAGVYRQSWDGRNTLGQSMPTGVYFAVLKTSGFSQTIKMMLVK